MSVTLVAGGAGFLGAAIARRVAAAGGRVLVADALVGTPGEREVREARVRELAALANVTFLRVDLSSPMRLEPFLRRYRPADVVNAVGFDPRGPGLCPLVAGCTASKVRLFLHLSRPGEKEAEEALVQAAGLPHAILRIPALDEGGAADGADAAVAAGEPRPAGLAVDEVVRAVFDALQAGPTRDVLVLGPDGSVARLPGDPARPEEEAAAVRAVSRRDLFGFFRRPLDRGALPG